MDCKLVVEIGTKAEMDGVGLIGQISLVKQFYLPLSKLIQHYHSQDNGLPDGLGFKPPFSYEAHGVIVDQPVPLRLTKLTKLL